MSRMSNESRTESVRKHEIWVWPVVVALSATTFILGWIIVTKTLASKDIRLEQIKGENQLSQIKAQKP